jgi:hypothetical protein
MPTCSTIRRRPRPYGRVIACPVDRIRHRDEFAVGRQDARHPKRDGLDGPLAVRPLDVVTDVELRVDDEDEAADDGADDGLTGDADGQRPRRDDERRVADEATVAGHTSRDEEGGHEDERTDAPRDRLTDRRVVRVASPDESRDHRFDHEPPDEDDGDEAGDEPHPAADDGSVSDETLRPDAGAVVGVDVAVWNATWSIRLPRPDGTDALGAGGSTTDGRAREGDGP